MWQNYTLFYAIELSAVCKVMPEEPTQNTVAKRWPIKLA